MRSLCVTDSKGRIKLIQQNGKIKKEENDEENEDEESDSLSTTLMNYEDPGAYLDDKDDIKIETEDYSKTIHGLACALLQISQAIDVKYFKPPYGNLKSGGKHGTKEEKCREGTTKSREMAGFIDEFKKSITAIPTLQRFVRCHQMDTISSKCKMRVS